MQLNKVSIVQLGLDTFSADVGESVAAEQIATEVIDKGQRVAVGPVTHAELAFEIDSPNLVGSGGVERCRAGMLPASVAAPRPDTAVPFENVEDGAAGGPVPVRKTFAESFQHLSGAPAVTAVLFQNQFHKLVRSLMGTRARCSAVVVEPTSSALPISIEPLVSGVPADTDLVYPGALHTRFHHALGAMYLMTRTLESLRLKGHYVYDTEAEAALLAILLHDIGHGPFSHTLEYGLLKSRRGTDEVRA